MNHYISPIRYRFADLTFRTKQSLSTNHMTQEQHFPSNSPFISDTRQMITKKRPIHFFVFHLTNLSKILNSILIFFLSHHWRHPLFSYKKSKSEKKDAKETIEIVIINPSKMITNKNKDSNYRTYKRYNYQYLLRHLTSD